MDPSNKRIQLESESIYSVPTPIGASTAAKAPKLMRFRIPHADLMRQYHEEGTDQTRKPKFACLSGS
jgi:hypothetical protein